MSTKSIRVLLADDHAVVRAGNRQFLEHAEDIEIIAEASEGLEAQELIRASQPDVAVLDIQMPGASGTQLGISDRTVQGHLARIFNKLQASSRTVAMMRAVSLGILPSDLVKPE